MKSLMKICQDIAMIEGKLMEGSISFSYDKLYTAMGAGHPAEILDEVLAPIYWPAMTNKEVDIKDVTKMYRGLVNYKKEFKVKELAAPIAELKEYLEGTGVTLTRKKKQD